MALRAVFFDAGNTLLNMDYAFIVEVLAQEGYPLSADAITEAERRARIRLDPLLAARRSTEDPGIFKAYMKFTCEGLGIPPEAVVERALGKIMEYNRAEGLWNKPNPDAFWVLRGLKAKGFILGVISNSNGTIEAILRRAGLAGFLNFVLDSAIVGIEKPDPRIFKIGLEKARVAPHEAVYIGDIYSVDILGSRAAGLHGILLDPIGAWEEVNCPKARDLAHARDLILGGFTGPDECPQISA